VEWEKIIQIDHKEIGLMNVDKIYLDKAETDGGLL
jgi:hypothetical protein